MNDELNTTCLQFSVPRSAFIVPLGVFMTFFKTSTTRRSPFGKSSRLVLVALSLFALTSVAPATTPWQEK